MESPMILDVAIFVFAGYVASFVFMVLAALLELVVTRIFLDNGKDQPLSDVTRARCFIIGYATALFIFLHP